MKTTFLAVKPKNHPFPIFSWLIRLIQGTEYSHFAIISEYSEDVLDARSAGVGMTCRSEFFEHYEIVKQWNTDLVMSKVHWNVWLHIQCMKQYSMWQNIGFLFKILGVTKCNPFGRGDRALICSELAAILVATTKNVPIFSDDFDLITTEVFLDRYCGE